MKRSLAMICLTTLAALLVLCGAVVPRAEALSFATNADFATYGQPYTVAVGDFNGDGELDLVAPVALGAKFSVLLGNGDGTFAVKTPPFATGGLPYSIAVGDFNSDGKRDLVTGNWADNTVSILLGNGDGTFAAKTDFPTGDFPSGVVVGDFNADGKQDLVTVGNSETVSVLLGNGDGTFAAMADFATGGQPWSVAVGDFNADGNQDLVTVSSPGTVSILLGSGDGAFASMIDFATASLSHPVAVGDFNRDGKQDLVAACGSDGPSGVSVLRGNGDGTFAARTEFATASLPHSVAVGDFNGDGRQDLATANWSDGSVSVLRGYGDGRFAARTDFGVTDFAVLESAKPESVAVGDFNGDGKKDLVTANSAAGSVSVLLNTTKPKVASLTPARGRVGTTLTIVGSPAGWSFGATRAAAKVYFGTKAVTRYVSWSKYEIRVRVPAMSKGRKAVTVRTSAGKSNTKYFTVI